MASLRCSLEVRSRISTPSRWSISCWITRASRPEASTRRSAPVSSSAFTRTCSGRSTSTVMPGMERQPSSPHSLSSLDHSTSGFTSAISGASLPTR
jgi:hypothetical protein